MGQGVGSLRTRIRLILPRLKTFSHMNVRPGTQQCLTLLGNAVFVFALTLIPEATRAAVQDVLVTDVTPRAFSVVWASDEPVTGAVLQVFSDAGGTDDITGNLSVSLVAPSGALAKGLAKIDVVGVQEDTTYYFRLVSQGAGGDVPFPESGDLPSLHTPLRVAVATPSGAHLVNPVLRDTQLEPDATTPAPDSLLVVEVPGASAYPVSGFVGTDGLLAPDVIVDLNNLYAADTEESLALVPGTPLRLTAYRGLDCAGLQDQLLVRHRRDPNPPTGPPITVASYPDSCFAPGGIGGDFDCNGTIDTSDTDAFAQQFGNATSTAAPSCAFNPDHDFTGDRRVGAGDFNLLLSVFGDVE